MSTASNRSWSRDRTWSMWAGERRDLERLLEVVTEQAESTRSAYVSRTTKYAREAVDRAHAYLQEIESRGIVDQEHFLERVQRTKDEREAELDEEVQKAAAAPILDVYVRERGSERQRVKGDLADAMSIIDERRCREVSIEAPAYRDSALEITVDLDELGARLRVRAEDSSAGRAAFDVIARELDDTAPRYAFISGSRVLPPVSAAAMSATAFALLRAVNDSPTETWNWVAFAVVIGVALAYPVSWLIRRFLLPGFSLVRDGHAHRGRRRWKFIGALVAWIASLVLPSWLAQ